MPQAVDPVIVGVAVAVVVAVVALVWWLARRRRLGSVEAPAVGTDEPRPRIGGAPSPATGEGDAAAIARRFFDGLARTREALARRLSAVLGGGSVDERALQELEDALIGADVGVRAAMEITEAVRRQAGKDGTTLGLHRLLKEQILARLGPARGLADAGGPPLAVLVVGVNGSGKTTTIGKLAARYKRSGMSVMLAAGDTFRAGAIEQLKVWGERAGVPVVAHQEGADPAAVIFDALQAAGARGIDVVICDTAGRLQSRKPLMDELGKVVRAMNKAVPGAPHEVLLVLDATIGQNALSQARVFGEVVGVTGVALTKLDGTARGGVVVAVREDLGIPVKLVGLGEGIEDLRDFDPVAFAEALVGDPN